MEHIDRAEFAKRLKMLFSGYGDYDQNDVVEALLDNDQPALAQMRADVVSNKGRINGYLNAWDNAPNQAAKDAIVGSVTLD